MIDKKITLALILTIAAEAAGMFAWGGATTERLKQLEARASLLDDAGARLARVETKIEGAVAQLARVERKIDNL